MGDRCGREIWECDETQVEICEGGRESDGTYNMSILNKSEVGNWTREVCFHCGQFLVQVGHNMFWL